MENSNRVRSIFNPPGITREKNTMPSLTVPDQSMSILQIMQNHSRGIMPGVKTPLYHDEATIDQESGRDIRTMDIVEVTEELQEINDRLQQTAREKQAKKAEASALKEQQAREEWLSSLSPEELEKRFKKPVIKSAAE